ncbi:MAG: hypothetical protein ACE5ES_05455 [Candidatus Nanoarchaeia archaeon]
MKFLDLEPMNLSEVAIDLENYLQRRGIPANGENIKEVATTIKSLAKEIRFQPPMSLFRAIGLPHLKYMGEMALQLHLASRELEHYQDLSKERLENLRDFCMRLSREAIIFQQKDFSRRKYAVA